MHWEPIEYVSVIQHDRAIQLSGRRFEEVHTKQTVATKDVVVCLAFATSDGKRIHRTFTFEGSDVFVATSQPQ